MRPIIVRVVLVIDVCYAPCAQVCCLTFKMATLTEEAELQRWMSMEQLLDFQISADSLSLALLATILGTMFVSFAISTALAAREEHRRRIETRAARARRLRWIADGSVVIAPELSSTQHPEWAMSKGILPWHLFPSHNWSQGQSDMCAVRRSNPPD